MGDLIIIGILLCIIGSIVAYLYKAKKRGQTCIGCPYGGQCGGRREGGCCTGQKKEEAHDRE